MNEANAEVDKRLPALGVFARDLAPRALVVGDPQRAAQAARLLENSQELGYHREYRTFTGWYAGKRVTVCSHGVGGSGASVCFHELFAGGVRTVIRAGTCGALVNEIEVGDLVIARGAIREDGVSEQLAPLAYPAVVDWRVIAALEAAANEQSELAWHEGMVLTQAYLYPGLLQTTTELWVQAGAVAVEMELATLLVMAGLRGLRAGGIFCVDGNLARKKQPRVDTESYDPHREQVRHGVERMLAIALLALIRSPEI